MIETTRPMSEGRGPLAIGPTGSVVIVVDSSSYQFTNREVTFPSYPTEAKGYVASGFGLCPIGAIYGGGVQVEYIGYDERIDYIGSDTYVYRTPKFRINIVQDDVINRRWIGATISMSADQTTDVYDYVDPGPEVLVSSTPTPQTFTYTFSAADDPTIGSPDYIPPSQTNKEVLGTEYLYSSFVYTSLSSPISYTRTETLPAFLTWLSSGTTPP